MTLAAIIVAAGRGTRAGGVLPKQWRQLAGQSVLSHTLAAFADFTRVLVIHPDDRAMAGTLAAAMGVELVNGGATRTQSVRNALEALAGRGITKVLIHDGARPVVSQALISRVLAALDTEAAAAPGLPLTDALWKGAEGYVVGPQSRQGLLRAQTPQGFDFDTILSAHRAHDQDAADDVEVAQAQGIKVAIVPGEDSNLKLTYPEDFAKAEAVLKGRKMDVRMGNGFDVHGFCPGDHVWLCGVKVPHSMGLLGHSDADVGLHALTDAIYGALAEGDIGQHFPPSDPQWQGAASAIFLRHAADRLVARGLRLGNADVTLICEYPKIGPHALPMRMAIAGILQVAADQISVKATTTEKLGFTGRSEGIAALATVTLVSA